MNIGIITFHRASKYGAVLQTYALQEALTKLRCTDYIIDYRTPQVEYNHDSKYAIRRHGLIKGGISIQIALRKTVLFENFRKKRLTLTRQVAADELASIADSYDVIIAGFDQVWSGSFGNSDLCLFLWGVNSSKCYSYSCSLGMGGPSERSLEVYRHHFPSFRVVSLRERSAKEIVEEKMGCDTRLDVNSTQLLSKDDWSSFCVLPKQSGCVLVYMVLQPIRLQAYARWLSSKTGMKVVYLNNSYRSARDFPYKRFASPERFVGWFANAHSVLSNFFRRTVFDCIYRRNMHLESRTARGINNRFREPIDSCGIEDRMLPDAALGLEAARDDFQPWEKCDAYLDSAKTISLAYLSSIGGTE